jgi:isoleucyl-tRNA synthetase
MVYRSLLDYVGDLSSVYLDVLKDRLYADAPASVSRCSAQTVLARILGVLVRVLAPVLSFTCEEVWGYAPETLRDAESVHLSDWPTLELDSALSAAVRDAYVVVLQAREVANAALEQARADKTIGKSQEAAVVLSAPADVADVLRARGSRALSELFIVASVDVVAGNELSATVAPASGEKCPRCWNFREVGTDPDHPEVCARCADVLAEIGR